MGTITTRTLAALSRKRGSTLSERISHGHGSLMFRALAAGRLAIYFQYTDEGKQKVHVMGRYDESGLKGHTLVTAREEARMLSKKHSEGLSAIREHASEQRRARNAALRRTSEGSFGSLLDSYVAALQADGKDSALQVRQMFDRWVKRLHPDLLTRKASAITSDDVMDILVGAARAGVTRQVNKLRSFLLAAFNRAIAAKGNPFAAAQIGAGYGIGSNPVAGTTRDRRYDVALDRVLTETELRGYLKAADELPLITGSLLSLAIMLGGQRPQQLLRVTRSDVDLEAGTIRLLDPKGRRQQAREHILPIPREAEPVLQTLLALDQDKAHLFTSTGKSGHLRLDTLSRNVTMKIGLGKYTLRDIRRTCETMLASMGISKDVRAQLLSHGISGVQSRHYDRYTYMDEMRTALEAWCARLADIKAGRKHTGNVVTLRRG